MECRFSFYSLRELRVRGFRVEGFRLSAAGVDAYEDGATGRTRTPLSCMGLLAPPQSPHNNHCPF